MKVYVVIVYRYGFRKGHHFPLGVYSDLEKAKAAAEAHWLERGGKYESVVTKFTLDEFEEEAIQHGEIVWKSEAML